MFGITFYGLQTIQGPLQGLRTFNAYFHFTDWVIGHVHMGTMGWVTMIISASFYYMRGSPGVSFIASGWPTPTSGLFSSASSL